MNGNTLAVPMVFASKYTIGVTDWWVWSRQVTLKCVNIAGGSQ